MSKLAYRLPDPMTAELIIKFVEVGILKQSEARELLFEEDK